MSIVVSPSGDSTPDEPDLAPRSRIASAAGMQIAARLLGTVTSLVTVSLTTRTLGPESYGHLQSALMFVTLWTSLTELGMNSVIVRRVTSLQNSSPASLRENLHHLVRVNLGLSTVLSIPLTLATFGCGALIYRETPEVVTMIGVISAMLLLNAIASSFDPIFMVSVRFRAVALADFLGRVLSAVATVVLVLCGADLYWFAGVLLIPYVISLLVKGYAARRLGLGMPIYSAASSWNLLRESLPQTVIIVVAVLYWRIDGVILSMTSTAEQVGLYGLAYTLAFTASMVSDLYLNTTLSTSTELFASSRRRFVDFSRRNFEVLYLLAIPLAVIGGVLSEGLVTLVGSSEFAGGGPVLAVLFTAAAVTFVNAAASQALFAAHQQVFLVRINLFNLAVNIVLNVLLASHFGALGSAVALLITELLGVLLTSLKLYRLSLYVQPIRFVAWCIPPVALGASLAWLFGGISVVVAGLVAGLAYVAAAVFAGPARPAYLKSLLAGGADNEIRAGASESDGLAVAPAAAAWREAGVKNSRLTAGEERRIAFGDGYQGGASTADPPYRPVPGGAFGTGNAHKRGSAAFVPTSEAETIQMPAISDTNFQSGALIPTLVGGRTR